MARRTLLAGRVPVQRVGVLAATLALLASSTALVVLPAGSAVAADGIRTNPGRVVRTVSFRTVLDWAQEVGDDPAAGRYVTVANYFEQSEHMYEAGTKRSKVELRAQENPNPILVEFGVFGAGTGVAKGKVRLLAANGLWVRLVNGVAVADTRDWDDATMFKVVEPRRLTNSVQTALAHADPHDPVAPIPTDGLVCVNAHASDGGLLGRMGIKTRNTSAGNTVRKLKLVENGRCGARVRTLFHTDLAPGASLRQRVDVKLADPLMHVRFVPPDETVALSAAEIREATQLINIYFGKARDHIFDLHDKINDQFTLMVNDVQPTGYANPAPPKASVMPMIVDGLTDLVSAVPVVGGTAPAARGIATLTMAGLSTADEADRDEPRYIKSIFNQTLLAENELRAEILRQTVVAGRRVARIEDRIFAGCASDEATVCRSQRAMAVWLDNEPKWPSEYESVVTREALAAQLERQMWPTMLLTRGVLAQLDGSPFGAWDLGRCDVLWSGNTPDVNPGLFYEQWLTLPEVGGTVSPTLVAAGNCQRRDTFLTGLLGPDARDVVRTYGIGLRNEDGSTEPLPQRAVDRLFDSYDPDDPLGVENGGSGLGFSKRDIACSFDSALPIITGDDMDDAFDYGIWNTTDPCHFKYTAADGDQWRSPLFEYGNPPNIGDAWNPPLQYKPGMFAMWMPDEPAIDDGRLPLGPDGTPDPGGAVPAPDVVPPNEPRAEWSACSGGRPDPSGFEGAPTSIYFLNLTGDLVYLREWDAQGDVVSDHYSLPMDGRRFHLVANEDTYGQALLRLDSDAGHVFRARSAAGRCLGYWTTTGGNENGNYSVAEVHLRS